jgi:hypothetical protein
MHAANTQTDSLCMEWNRETLILVHPQITARVFIHTHINIAHLCTPSNIPLHLCTPSNTPPTYARRRIPLPLMHAALFGWLSVDALAINGIVRTGRSGPDTSSALIVGLADADWRSVEMQRKGGRVLGGISDAMPSKPVVHVGCLRRCKDRLLAQLQVILFAGVERLHQLALQHSQNAMRSCVVVNRTTNRQPFKRKPSKLLFTFGARGPRPGASGHRRHWARWLRGCVCT